MISASLRLPTLSPETICTSFDPSVLRRQVIFSALAEGGPSAATMSESLQRLLFDVFQQDVREFRRVSYHLHPSRHP